MARSGVAEKGSDPYFASRESLDTFRALSMPGSGACELVAAHFRRDQPDLGVTTPNEASEVWMAVVNLRPLGSNNVWCDGRYLRRAAMRPGSVFVLDHRQRWESEVSEAFETVHIFMPIKDLMNFSENTGGRKIDSLNCPITTAQHDPVMYDLARALLPAIKAPHEVNTLFADHLFSAIRLHMVTKYGSLLLRDAFVRGGLTPRQKRVTSEMLLENMKGDVTVGELAAECGLSPRQFSRAFKVTHGMPPHRWLLSQRTELAKVLLEGTTSPIAEIASTCGFVDQSHLTRVFRAHVNVTPASWRASRRH